MLGTDPLTRIHRFQVAGKDACKKEVDDGFKVRLMAIRLMALTSSFSLSNRADCWGSRHLDTARRPATPTLPRLLHEARRKDRCIRAQPAPHHGRWRWWRRRGPLGLLAGWRPRSNQDGRPDGSGLGPSSHSCAPRRWGHRWRRWSHERWIRQQRLLRRLRPPGGGPERW